MSMKKSTKQEPQQRCQEQITVVIQRRVLEAQRNMGEIPTYGAKRDIRRARDRPLLEASIIH